MSCDGKGANNIGTDWCWCWVNTRTVIVPMSFPSFPLVLVRRFTAFSQAFGQDMTPTIKRGGERWGGSRVVQNSKLSSSLVANILQNFFRNINEAIYQSFAQRRI